MTNHQHLDPAAKRHTSADKWAPWWLYLVILLGANYLRGYFMMGSSLPELAVAAIAILQATLLFVIITAIWRFTQRGRN